MIWKIIRKFMVTHWIALTAGFFLMSEVIRISYPQRGSAGIGGEWLIVPFFLFVSVKLNSIKVKKRGRM